VVVKVHDGIVAASHLWKLSICCYQMDLWKSPLHITFY